MASCPGKGEGVQRHLPNAATLDNSTASSRTLPYSHFGCGRLGRPGGARSTPSPPAAVIVSRWSGKSVSTILPLPMATGNARSLRRRQEQRQLTMSGGTNDRDDRGNLLKIESGRRTGCVKGTICTVRACALKKRPFSPIEPSPGI